MRHLREFAVTVFVLAVLGVIAGFVWAATAPRTLFVSGPDGDVPADPTTQTLIAADGWFAVVTGLLGLASGIVGHVLSRKRPLPVVVGLAVGGMGASLLTFGVGRVVCLSAPVQLAAGPTGTTTTAHLVLTAHGVLMAWPFLAVGVFFAIEGVLAYRESPLRKPYGGQAPPLFPVFRGAFPPKADLASNSDSSGKGPADPVPESRD
ncbi:hypothetical protein [Sinosporangium siamense]|uniref:DUF2567 domain-containing protein n=1 Tax=Sinosporangium siamense TaxID=1367973 RepID=A0A919V5W1_9ACTN|nr:hypothetical protein [Sinosporangium siamense]GII90347.1 hypothetical protein Ssi02_05780 [Sinosporangium siamense]